ncbi:MAG: DNA polymerase III subunit delta' [Parcubacteria group bacterium Gr01-1014_30]|nr:MAG: DNA polymerase III subunit delta' [Parcubacteria group bacterium Gr01-1014_30]
MILSNQKKLEYLKKLVEANKLTHALLVSGVTAKEFVLQLFGHDISKVHPDFVVVGLKEEEIKISQVRDCIWRLSLKPSTALLKVAVINQAHLMNQEAQSALLKTLEEPKGEAFLVLVTEFPDALLPTIISRVQRVKFFSQEADKPRDYSGITALTKADLAERFKYAENISKSPALSGVLTTWLYYFRRDVIKNKAILQKIQNTLFLIERTNVNRRLALETLMLHENF